MSRSTTIPVLASVLLALALPAPWARATQMILQSVEQLTYRADAVVHAVPSGAPPSSRWSQPDGKGVIVTTTRFRAIEGLAGPLSPGQEFEIDHLGGTVGELSLMVPGMPVFRAGEEVVLFARQNPDGRYHVLDLSMGKFEVVPGGAGGGRRLTRRDLQEVDLVGESSEVPRTLGALRGSVLRFADRKARLLRAGRPLPEMGSALDAIEGEDR